MIYCRMGDARLRRRGKRDDLWANEWLASNDKYEINRVTLIYPKHNSDVLHSVSIKGRYKKMVSVCHEGKEAMPFWTLALTESVAAIKGTTSAVWSLNRLLMAHG